MKLYQNQDKKNKVVSKKIKKYNKAKMLINT